MAWGERVRVWARTRGHPLAAASLIAIGVGAALALVLTVAGASTAAAQSRRPPEPLPEGAVVELRFAGPRDLPLIDEAGDTTVARGLRTIMGRVWEDLGDTLVLEKLSGRRPGDDNFRALPKDARVHVARADVSRLVVISRHPRAVHAGALVVAVGYVCLILWGLSQISEWCAA